MSARLLASLVFAPLLGAQQGTIPAPPDPAQQLQAKLQQPFLKHADWFTDWDLARQSAAKAGKLIFGYFTTAGY